MKSINFEFLRPRYPQLAVLGAFAEQYAHPDPASALVKLRSFAEATVQLIYLKFQLPEVTGGNLNDLLNDTTFQAAIPRVIISKLHGLRIHGNKAAHGQPTTTDIALRLLKEAHDLGKFVFLVFKAGPESACSPFQQPPPGGTLDATKSQLRREKRELLERLAAQEAEMQKLFADLAEERQRATRAEQSTEELAAKLQAGQQVAAVLELSEAQTRTQLIDTMIASAGWDIHPTANTAQVKREVEVAGQPTRSGNGRADYVLWGDNGKPLAVIEAKKTAESPTKGMTQARLYADALEAAHGQRPVIFYTNGFETYIWDDAQNQPPRRLYGFYSKDSLEYLHFQRSSSTAIASVSANQSITNRLYQLETIKRVAERFDHGHRRALIVQATGTGKTRTAISIVDVALRANRAKRVLFLCDRRELRKQALNAFKSHLPDASRTIVKADTAHERNFQLYFATYPAMMKCYESFDVGFFDLIIADESHRSIYNKYRDLFEYFDALQIGLTATPTRLIDRNTYALFGCEDRDPTAHYPLATAVEEGYLVPPRVRTFTTEFQREGMRYADMTPEQQRQLEEHLGTSAQDTDYDSTELDRLIFNKDTNRAVLRNLLENGIRMPDGALGKTIIFARSHRHAVLLKELFDEGWPQYGGAFCQVVDHYNLRAEQLIDDFKGQGRNNDLVIAISVDMLDTGLDVPEVVNLVFAKPVKSYVKFWQMIGRGTRLCPDLFGPGEHKTEFVIFDHWGNFGYFGETYTEPTGPADRPLLQRLFEARVRLAATTLQRAELAIFERVVRLLADDLAALEETRTIAVRERWREIKSVGRDGVLDRFEPSTRAVLEQVIAPLMRWRNIRGFEAAYRFDLLMASLQHEVLAPAGRLDDYRGQLTSWLDQLQMSLRQVRAKAEVIRQLRARDFWDHVSFDSLEHARRELRSIMQHRDVPARQPARIRVVDVRESRASEQIADYAFRLEGLDLVAYRKRVQAVLEELFEDNRTLQKIKAGEPVTAEELSQLTSLVLAEDPTLDLRRLEALFPSTAGNLDLAIRRIIGLDAEQVEVQFSRFVEKHPALSAQQVQFLRLLKNHIGRYGAIELDRLYEPPFTTLHSDGIEGLFAEDQIDELLTIVATFERPSGQEELRE